MGRANYQYLPLSESQFESLEVGDISGKEKYEIRQRIQHTLMNGSAIWYELGIDQKTFETVGGPSNNTRKFDQSDVDDTKKLQRGLIGWLAFLYAGIEERPNLYANKEGIKYPNTCFDFELLLREAINKVENRRGRHVTDFSLEIETEPIPDGPGGDFDTDRLLTRFNERDPTLTGLEIAHLQHEGAIDGGDWERYNEEAYGSPQERVGGMVGEDTDITEEFRKESDGT